MRTTPATWIHRRKLAAMRHDTARRARLANECRQIVQRVIAAALGRRRCAGSPVAAPAVLRARQS